MAENPNAPLLDEIQARYTAAKEHASKWRECAREEFRFYAGDQWDEKDIHKLEEQQRPVVTFNRIMRLVNAVIGHEANNRAEIRYIPRTQGDAKVSELLTSASQYFRDSCDAEFEESDAFRDDIICGMGWTGDRLSDAENPEYDLITERVDPMEMLWDPSAKKPNLADARYLFRRKRYTEKEIKAIWPDFSGPYISAFDDDSDDSSEPHQTNPRSSYQGDGTSRDVKPDVLVIEYQYKERQAFYAIGPVLGAEGQVVEQQFEVPVEDMDDGLKKKLEERQIRMTVKRRTVTRRCFVIGHTIVQGPDIVCPHDFTYHCITGFRDREKNHWFGIVRMLLDPQRWSNKWLAQIMHIINANAKGGLMAEEDAVADRHEFEASWADPAAVTWFAAGALKDKRVEQKPPPVYPAGVDKLLQYATDSFTDVSGVNQELLGLADRDQPGVLEWQRKQSAVTLLAPLFDPLRRFRKMQGRVWLYMMQKYVSDGRIIRITQDTPAGKGQQVNVPFELPPQWKDPQTAQFDVIVDQASTAPNQKEQTWAVLTQLFPVLKDGMPPSIMMLALEYSPLPESFVQKTKELMAAQEAKGPPPDPEMMKAQAQIQAKQQEAQLNLAVKQQEMQLEQQKAQMQLEIEKARMALELEKAQMQMGIEREKAGQTMQLQQQQAYFDAQQQQAQAQRDAQMQEQQLQAQTARDDATTQAKIKREDRTARAKARRQPKDGATA